MRRLDEGGRLRRLSQYRPDLKFLFDDVYVYGCHFLSDLTVAPGDSFESDVLVRQDVAKVQVLANITVGMEFGVMEGAVRVADGVVIAIFPLPPEPRPTGT